MRMKVPGERMQGQNVQLIASHQPCGEMSPYERLLGDALRGDLSLFAREDTVEAQWKIVDGILGDATPLNEYEQNTWGPAEAASLIEDPSGWSNPLPAGALAA